MFSPGNAIHTSGGTTALGLGPAGRVGRVGQYFFKPLQRYRNESLPVRCGKTGYKHGHREQLGQARPTMPNVLPGPPTPHGIPPARTTSIKQREWVAGQRHRDQPASRTWPSPAGERETAAGAAIPLRAPAEGGGGQLVNGPVPAEGGGVRPRRDPADPGPRRLTWAAAGRPPGTGTATGFLGPVGR